MHAPVAHLDPAMKVGQVERLALALSNDRVETNSSLCMFYVYILHLNNHTLYTGQTGDLKRRYNEHKLGRVASTKNKRPLELIFYEAYIKKTDVDRRERFLKTTEGKRLLRQQLRDILKEKKII